MSIDKTEEQYQAEWDARSLAEAEKIKADKGRLERATEAAGNIIEEQKDEYNAMKMIAEKDPEMKKEKEMEDEMDDGRMDRRSRNTASRRTTGVPMPVRPQPRDGSGPGGKMGGMPKSLNIPAGNGVTRII